MSEQGPTVAGWDEMWCCPVHEGTGIAIGNGKRGGGNAIVEFTTPPRCWCGREMEQRTDFPIPPRNVPGEAGR